MEYMTLMGAEDVQRAGKRMCEAADNMQRAASSFEYQVDRLERILREHADRISSALNGGEL